MPRIPDIRLLNGTLKLGGRYVVRLNYVVPINEVNNDP